MWFFFFPLLLLIFYLVCKFCPFDYCVACCVFPWVCPARNSLYFLDLVEYFLSHVRKVFSYYLFKHFLRFFLSSPFLWVLVCARFCVWPPRMESLPKSFGSPVIKYHWTSRSDSLGILSAFIRFPGWEAWCGIQNLHNSGIASLVLFVVLQFVGYSPAGRGFDFIVITCLLLSCLSVFFVFGHGASFFLGFHCPPVDGCSTPSCDFGALRGGEEHTSFYSAILNRKEILHFLYTIFV